MTWSVTLFVIATPHGTISCTNIRSDSDFELKILRTSVGKMIEEQKKLINIFSDISAGMNNV